MIEARSQCECRWRAVDPEGFSWLPWLAENSLFSRATGETHLLSELPAFVLRCLSEESYSFEQVCAVTADACETVHDNTWRKTIANLLSMLDDSELAECLEKA